MLSLKPGLRMWLSNVTSQVWPSGGDLAATVAPMTPAAPGLFSTTICQPVVSPSLAAMMRAIGSVPPPGGKGTMNFIGPLGHSAWAMPTPGMLSVAPTVPASIARRRNPIILSSQIRLVLSGKATPRPGGALVALDVVVLDDLEPELLFALLVGGERLGRSGHDLHVELLDELLRHVRVAHRLGDLAVHAIDDQSRRARRRIDAPPRIGRVGLYALLGESGRIGQGGRALLAGDGDRPDLVGADMRAERGQARDSDIGHAARQVLHQGRAALVGDEVHPDAIFVVDQRRQH